MLTEPTLKSVLLFNLSVASAGFGSIIAKLTADCAPVLVKAIVYVSSVPGVCVPSGVTVLTSPTAGGALPTATVLLNSDVAAARVAVAV